jgi:hypothetical protein
MQMFWETHCLILRADGGSDLGGSEDGIGSGAYHRIQSVSCGVCA